LKLQTPPLSKLTRLPLKLRLLSKPLLLKHLLQTPAKKRRRAKP
jgi:hypothetical protein